MIPPPPPADRTAVRELLRLEGFGDVDNGVHLHPGISPDDVRHYLAGHGIHDAVIFQARLASGAAPSDLISRGWNLTELKTVGESLEEIFLDLTKSEAASQALADVNNHNSNGASA